MLDSPFLTYLLLASLALLLVLLSHRAARHVPLPLPLVPLLLASAATALHLVPDLSPSSPLLFRALSLLLLLILFEGGRELAPHLSLWRPILSLGLGGTLLTCLLLTLATHYLLALPWLTALLAAAALSPTDPAVVFSLFRSRRPSGLATPLLQGESGANDPVSISLLSSFLLADSLSTSSFLAALLAFALQLLVGSLLALLAYLLLSRLPDLSDTLRPLRLLALLLLLFATTSLLHGSGFLAVFLLAALLARRELPAPASTSFLESLTPLVEATLFLLLGLTLPLSSLTLHDLLLALLLTLFLLLARLTLYPLLLTSPLLPRERLFVLLAGLKGAVPLLLAALLTTRALPGPLSSLVLYHVLALTTILSTLLLAYLLPPLARRLLPG